MNLNSVVIEKLIPEDLEKIFKLEKSVFQLDAFPKDSIYKLINSPTLFLKLIYEENKKKIIGYIIVLQDHLNTANIINFLIHPKFQNKGYGSYLLEKSLDLIKRNPKITKIILNVKRTNAAAISLYKKYTFQTIKTIENYYHRGEDAYEMELEI